MKNHSNLSPTPQSDSSSHLKRHSTDKQKTSSVTKLNNNDSNLSSKELSHSSDDLDDETVANGKDAIFQKTIYKLSQIIEQKANIEAFQKERIAKLEQKITESQSTLAQLKHYYDNHQQILNDLQKKNRTLQQSFEEMKAKSKNADDEAQNFYETIKQTKIENENLNQEIQIFNMKLSQHHSNDADILSRISLAGSTRDRLARDVEESRNSLKEAENNYSQWMELQSKIPEIQEKLRLKNQEINYNESVYEENSHILSSLNRENNILSIQLENEEKSLEFAQQKLSKLKIDFEAQSEIEKRFSGLTNIYQKNQKTIAKSKLKIKNDGKRLHSMKKIVQKQKHEARVLKQKLVGTQDALKPLKENIIKLSEENTKTKEKINDKVSKLLDEKIEKASKKNHKYQETNEELKKEIEEMKSIVADLEKTLEEFESIKQKIIIEQNLKRQKCNENEYSYYSAGYNYADHHNPYANYSTIIYPPTAEYLSCDLHRSLKRVENNNDHISSMIDDNHSLQHQIFFNSRRCYDPRSNIGEVASPNQS